MWDTTTRVVLVGGDSGDASRLVKTLADLGGYQVTSVDTEAGAICGRSGSTPC
jgi:hypothetical protein